MTPDELSAIYRAYIDCLNAQDWDHLGNFVDETARHNGRAFGLAGYRRMLEQDFRDIPDLRFNIELLVAEPPRIASRLRFDCSPRADFMGLKIDGRRVTFCENVFYTFRDGRITEVWSVIDKAAIETQL
ncbi:ester cyclase [Caballeronia sp. LZ034LL]|uniref:ester cyclase n=1 Tax=Caballeronia sp. LZ034LL TaxID=3038567 RepID=UPI002866DFA0|nr:ester cyclase [Caballeronia sp. LZ034LL]MDR5837478.1 ester cyclase [Caballeronia sp. LZ034LL]